CARVRTGVASTSWYFDVW
nr:immunoglobulin heavy chain junction region [Macaca mulatta]MOW19635.1 immunoglobulin heavy chain junction region [Macaca mulatta]MOW20166.1 immunoglobulin heavy chain junction region [Macaca mulatta]MOW20233.1 immunoglobulin heavy chain junction region [Macaca mulatta]MOW21134.1 immunoglobulin heavy chain junction region [Macaca mulatta]